MNQPANEILLNTIDGNYEDISDLQNDIDEQLDSIFQEFGGDENDTEFKITVKRVMEGKGALEHCFSCLPSELPVISRIKKEYGPGAYEIWIYKNGKIFKRPKLNIAKKVEDSLLPVAQIHTTDQNLNLILNQQNERFAALERTLDRISHQNNEPVDPMVMMNSAIGMAKDLLSLQTNQQQTDPMAMMGSMMGTMMQMKKFMSGFPDNAQDKDDGDTLGSLAKAFAPHIGSLMDIGKMEAQNRLVASKHPENGHQAPQHPENGHQAPQHPENGHQAPQHPENGNLEQAIAFLAAQAQQDKDPSLYADLVIDQYPFERLDEIIKMEGFIDDLAKSNQHVKTYKGWFTELFEHIKTTVLEEKENQGITEEQEKITVNDEKKEA